MPSALFLTAGLSPRSAAIWLLLILTGFLLHEAVSMWQRYRARCRAESTHALRAAIRYCCQPQYHVRDTGDQVRVYRDGRLHAVAHRKVQQVPSTELLALSDKEVSHA